MLTPYHIPTHTHRTVLVISRSRFIATLGHAADAAAARAFIDRVRAEFPDATHNCWAYVAGPPGSTAGIGLSDAGEPHGTAGRPMLDVLLHSAIGEVAAVVTRYYGGTKLGRGGLVRAYGGAVQRALAELPTVLRVERTALRITAPYGDADAVRRVLAESGSELRDEGFAEVVRWRAAVPAAAAAQVVREIVDRTAGRAVVEEDAEP
jgi:uncharacterized YigZ family protein